jgi:thymidine kinase
MNNPGIGSIEVICGSMFSGKSEELIRRLTRASVHCAERIVATRRSSGRPKSSEQLASP